MEDKKNNKIVPILIISIIVLGLYSLKDNFNFSVNSPKTVDDVVLEKLEKLSKDLNAQLPKMIDEHTSLDNTYTLGKIFASKYTVSDEIVAIGKEEVTKYMKETLVNDYCTLMVPTFKFFREYGVGIKSSYYSGEGELITEISITTKNCPKDIIES